MRKLKVGLDTRSYDILIENGLLNGLGTLLRPLCKPGAAIVTISDEHVWSLHGQSYQNALKSAGLESEAIVVPPGEQSKSLTALERVYTECARRQLRRDGLMVAFGGGVTGDLCGFAAATYLRGVPFVQIPTSLLSQVDSAVGGKTAINMPFAKNSVGAFYQPRLVVIDPKLLETLPERELRSGMAEIIKHGAIRDAALFDSLFDETTDWADIIAANCAAKSAVVARDEHDKGERMLLNFGHSFGHAVEKHYGGTDYNHGEAVAVGMLGAALMGERLGLSANGTAERLRALFARHGLDGRLPCPLAALWDYVYADKKSGADGLQMVFLRRIGEAFLRPLAYETLKQTAAEVETAWRT